MTQGLGQQAGSTGYYQDAQGNWYAPDGQLSMSYDPSTGNYYNPDGSYLSNINDPIVSYSGQTYGTIGNPSTTPTGTPGQAVAASSSSPGMTIGLALIGILAVGGPGYWLFSRS